MTAELAAARALEPDAGATVPGKAAGVAYTALSYQHSALAGRTVVRLVPQELAAAEDIAVAALGFRRTDAIAVGRGPARPLRFPAWVLIKDPANAGRVPALVAELNQGARVARTKPKAARAIFDEIARELARSVPQLLPTFLEQAGRVFLATDTKSLAAAMFEAARDAERVHNLPIDEDRHREVFLEFATAGGLGAATMSAEARSLSRRHHPTQAYALFRRLCIERARSGVAPHTSMVSDLRRLAKTASLDIATVDRELARELLRLPSTFAAASGFWTSWRQVVVDLAKTDDETSTLLTRSFGNRVGLDEWIGLLEDAGVLARLAGGWGDPTDWLSRLIREQYRRWRRNTSREHIFALAEQMIPAIKASGRSLNVHVDHYHVYLELIELALANDIPLAEPKIRPYWRFDVRGWVDRARPGPHDFTHLAGSERYGPPFRDGVITAVRGRLRGESHQGGPTVDLDEVRAVSGLDVARRVVVDWLTARTERPYLLTLPELGELIDDIAGLASQPDSMFNTIVSKAVATVDFADLLATTLNAGVADEFGWPALDDAMERRTTRMQAKGRSWAQWPSVQLCWPFVLLVDADLIDVIGPSGVVLSHVPRLPPHPSARMDVHPQALYVDGELLVGWRDHDGRAWAYWSSRPDVVFPTTTDRLPWRNQGGRGFPLPGGGRTEGDRLVRPGQTDLPNGAATVSGNGTHYWRQVQYQGPWEEFDPATGHIVDDRRSLEWPGPETNADDGWVGFLRPLPAELVNTPLGQRNAIAGGRTFHRPDGTRRFEGIDGWGTEVGPRLPPTDTIEGRLSFPGGSALLLSHGRLSRVDDGAPVAALTQYTQRPYQAGTPLSLAPVFWHCYRPRDPRASEQLRRVTRDDVMNLLDAAGDSGEPSPIEQAAVDGLLPGADRRLQHGVLGIARIAHRQRADVSAWPAATPSVPAGGSAPTGGSVPADHGRAIGPVDEVLISALSGLLDVRQSRTFGRKDSWVIIAQVAMAGALLTGGQIPAPPEPPDAAAAWPGHIWDEANHLWVSAIGTPAALLWRAVSPVTTPEQSQALAELLERLLDHDLIRADVRAVRIERRSGDGPITDRVFDSPSGSRAVVIGITGHRYESNGESWAQWTVIERGERQGDIGPYQPNSVEPVAGINDPELLRSAVHTARARGQVRWNPRWVADLSERTGMSRSEAALLLAGLPGIGNPEKNFLPQKTRDMIGINVDDALGARAFFLEMPAATRRRLLAAAVPADPDRLWPEGPDVAGMADTFIDLIGRQAPVPDELLSRARKEMGHVVHTNSALRLLAEIERPRPGSARIRNFRVLQHTLITTVWLAAALPNGDPFRARLFDAYAVLRETLSAARAPFTIGNDSEGRYRTFFGVADAEESASVGAFILRRVDRVDVLAVELNRLSAADAIALWTVALIHAQPPSREVTYVHKAAVLSALVSASFAALVDRIDATNDDDGGWDQCPEVCAPELVATVADRLGVSRSAAALFLQALALPDPTSRNVRAWNGWSAATLTATENELVERGRLVRGVRARAGRKVFLPGGWFQPGGPDLPLETWKAPLYGIDGQDGSHPWLGRILVVEPMADLFQRAWSRYLSHPPQSTASNNGDTR